MSFRRRALFLAGLFVAVSCSDAGNPIGPGGPEQPIQPGDEFLAALTCTVNVRAGTETCGPAQPAAGDAQLGLVLIVNATQVTLTTTNIVSTPTSLSYDRSITNNIYQALGTLDGVTPHAAGVRVLVEPPFAIDTAVAGQPTSVTVANADGTLTYKTFTNRPYFQYAGLLQPGATSATDNWAFNLQNVDAFSYKVFVLSEQQFPLGTLWITPEDPAVQVGTSDTVAAHIRDATKLSLDPVTWTSSNPAVATVVKASTADSLGVITGVGEGQAWIKAQSNHTREDYRLPRVDSVLVTVDNAPAVPLDSINGLKNVSIRLSATRLRQGLAEGDSVVPNQTFDSDHGHVVIDANRAFSYVPDGGFTGVDSVGYNVTDGRWTVERTVLVKVAPTNYWFVRQGATGDGSNASPLASINAAVALADGNDSIFVLRNGSNDLTGAAMLGAGQSLIGHGVPASFLVAANALNEPSRVDSIFQGQGVGTPLANSGAAPLRVASNNLVRGVNITSTNAAAIHGVSFGTLTVGDIIVQADGPSLSLQNGNLAGTFTALHSANSDSSGINLVNVGGTLTATASSISGAATTAFAISGGSVAISFPGNVTHAGTARLLDVSGHTGTATFEGALTATAGTGVLFSNADGAYTFNGAVTLAGGDAGMDVNTASDGSFTFANASISNPTGGPALDVSGGTPALVYRGSITHNTGRAVSINGITADSVVLRAAITSGTAGSPTGLGILVQNVTGGLVALDSVKSLFTAANPAVTLSNAAGTVRFGQAMDITTTTGAGFTASGAGTVSVTGVNTVATGTGIPVSLTSANTGAAGVSFSSISTSAGATNAIVLNGISGAGFQATGGTVSGTTGPAVLLTSTNSADSVSLRNMSFARTSGTGAVISGTTFGKLHVLNTSVTASGGPSALVLSTGTVSGTYSTLSSNSSTASGVSLTSVNGTLNASVGSINTAGAAAFLVSAGNVGGTISATVAQASAIPLLSVTNGHSGAFTFAGNVTATNGNGLQFDNADGSYIFTGTVSLNGGDAGIDITNTSIGTFSFPTTSNIVSPSTGNLVSILNSAPTFTYSGAFTKANNNVTGIFVSGNTGGSILFNGTGTKSINSGSQPAVNLASNTGTAITFSGGGLTLTSGSGAGFSATGGGTVQVTDNVNIISSSGGVALNVQNTTIGASGLKFQSISANGGANGIVLDNTGALNGLQVTGTSTAGSGGTIQNTTGADGASAGNGVYLNNTRNVSLSWMQLNDHGNNGIRGIDVVGVTLNKVRVTGANGTTEASPHNESAVFFTNLTGAASVTGSYFSGGKSNNFRLSNTSGSLNRIVMTSDTFAVQPGNPTDRLLNDALLIQGLNTATVNTTIQSTAFQSAGGDLFQYDLGGTAAGDLVLNGSAFSNNHSNIASGGGGVVLSAGGGGSPTFTYAVTNNTFRDSKGTALVVYKTSGTGTATGSITGNTIGVAGVGNSGSSQGAGMDIGNVGGGTHTSTITGNQIRQFTNYAGILLEVGNNTAANGGQGRMKAVVQSNTIAEVSPAAAAASIVTNGIHMNIGTNTGDNAIVCATIGGAGALANTVNGTGTNGGADIRPRARAVTNIVLPGYAGGAHNTATVNTFVQGNNAVAPTVSSVSNSGTGGSGFTGTCPF